MKAVESADPLIMLDDPVHTVIPSSLLGAVATWTIIVTQRSANTYPTEETTATYLTDWTINQKSNLNVPFPWRYTRH